MIRRANIDDPPLLGQLLPDRASWVALLHFSRRPTYLPAIGSALPAVLAFRSIRRAAQNGPMKSTDLTRDQAERLLADVTPMLGYPIGWASAVWEPKDLPRRCGRRSTRCENCAWPSPICAVLGSASGRAPRKTIFLQEEIDKGEVLDFHALRHNCGAWYTDGAASPNGVQALMRHQTIALTMDTYGHLFQGHEESQ